jgi:hypothetical protein
MFSLFGDFVVLNDNFVLFVVVFLLGGQDCADEQCSGK